MKKLVVLGLLALPGCGPAVVTNTIQLTPANPIALRDGTPVVRLSGYAGNPRATVSFIFPDSVTLSGDAVMNPDVVNSMEIWGQTPQSLSTTSTVQMVAVNEQQKMECSGVFGPQATDMTCNFSDGAVYRDFYIPPPPPQPGLAVQRPAR